MQEPLEFRFTFEKNFILQTTVLRWQWRNQHIRKLLSQQPSQSVEVYIFSGHSRSFWFSRDVGLNLELNEVSREEPTLHDCEAGDLDRHLLEVKFGWVRWDAAAGSGLSKLNIFPLLILYCLFRCIISVRLIFSQRCLCGLSLLELIDSLDHLIKCPIIDIHSIIWIG